MSENLVNLAIEMMKEQAVAYRRLCATSEQLVIALVRGEPAQIEVLTRTGERELLSMRARLAQLTATLTSFAQLRASTPNPTPVSPQTRAAFETASKELTAMAEAFQRSRQRAAILAVNGMAFASATIEMCGVQPTTYHAPYVRRGDGRPWV